MTEAPGKPWNKKYLAAGAAALVLLAAAGWWFGWFGPRGAEAELLAQTPYRVLKKHEAEAWARVLAAYQRIEGDAGRRSEFVNVSNQEFSAAATRRLNHAAPEAQLALMRDFVGTLKLLHSRMGDSCFKYLYPEIGGAADVARELDAGAQAHTLALSAEVIRSSAEEPITPGAPQAAADKLAPIVEAVYAEFGSDTQMLANAHEPGVDRIKVCDIAISLYEHILALPPADAALVLTAVATPE